MMASKITECYQTAHPKICNFYNNHANIDFERINLLLTDIFAEFDNRHEVKPPEMNENTIKATLNGMFPNASIQKIGNNDFLMKRNNKSTIYIENHYSFDNLTQDTVNHFTYNNEAFNCCGILVSHHSGIVDKNNFEIEISNGNIYVYIYKSRDDSKIQTAVQIIDSLQEKLTYLNRETSISNISLETLNEINEELQVFLSNRDEMNEFIKDFQKRASTKIDALQFKVLEDYLSTKINNVKRIGKYKCPLCNDYTSSTLKGIAAHKRGCVKKSNNIKIN